MGKGISKVPVMLQMEAVECGAASLAMVLAYYKKYIPLETVRSDCNVSRDGSSAKYIVMAARDYGLEAKGVKMSLERLRKQDTFPVIIHWNFNHFVVLCGFKGDKAIINDPAEGRVTVDMEEMEASFTGIVLTFKKGENFTPSGKPRSVWGFIKKYTKGSFAPLIFILTMQFFISVLDLIKPVFYKIFTDDLLIGNATEQAEPLFTAMIAVLLVLFVIEALRDVYLTRLQAKFKVKLSSSFMWHILRLPMDFFSQRFVGDIADRQRSSGDIGYTLYTQIAPVGFHAVMIGIYMTVMVFNDPSLSFIGIAAALFNIVLVLIVNKKNANDAKSVQRDAGKLSGSLVSTISMMETIKASGAEFGTFEKIAGYQVKYNNASLALSRRNTILGIVPQVLSDLGTSIVLVVGVAHIFNGQFTIGGLMAFQSIMGLFLTPVSDVVQSLSAFSSMTGNIERVEDVLNYDIESRPKCENQSETKEDIERLTGNIEIKNLTFAYGRLSPALIDDFNLTIEKGQMVALVGGSGSGKSTIAKIVTGLYKPRSGEILFDDKSIMDIDEKTFTSSLAMVDQNIELFHGSVRDNITMWDEDVPEEVLIQACKDACIHDDIMRLKGGYDAVIAEGGGNFSGGQRQKLEIARAFAVEPSILVLDEATSALDPTTEKLIMDAVRKRNMTCIIIAHRLSTIRDADKIIVLEYGKEVERGNHNELIEKDGQYAMLVRSE